MQLTRRRGLLFCGSALAGIVAGCSSDADPVDSRFDGIEVPNLTAVDGSELGDTVWYHESGGEEIFLEPSAERIDQPQGSIEFTLHNDSGETIEVNPDAWGLHKLVDDEWVRVAPLAVQLPAMSIPPGERRSDTFEFDNGAEDELSVGDGLYAYYYGDDGYAALFEVDGAPLALEPTGAITETETNELDDDAEAVSVVTHHYEEPVEDAKRATITVERTSEAEDVRKLLPEHVAQYDPLANTLPFFEENVTEVKLRTSGAARGFRSFRILSTIAHVLDGAGVFGYTRDDEYYDVSLTVD